jgi:hypothetical protein
MDPPFSDPGNAAMFARPGHYISDDVHKLLLPRGVVQSSLCAAAVCSLPIERCCIHIFVLFCYLAVW